MITSLRLQHFRSYRDDSFEFAPGVNIVVGPNASGKTNLLEALLCVSRGGSYRARDNELIQYKAAWARLVATSEHGSRVCKLERVGEQVKKSFEIGGRPQQRLNLTSSLPTVLFEPNHLLLLIGGPDLRRDFLDDILEQTIPGFALLRRQYRRAVAQRNALLKKNPTQAASQLFAWNIRLSELGGQIAVARMKLVDDMNTRLGSLYRKISRDKAKLSVQYETSCSSVHYATSLLHKLESHTSLDFERGFTAYGPHRDDLTFSLNGHSAKDVASRGETRTILLVLKIFEVEILEELRDQPPLLLLDDVFSELDGARRRALTQFLQKYQTFITTTDADVVIQHFSESTNVLPLSKA